ncbi:hypothetical protein [Streptomyces chartreusis]
MSSPPSALPESAEHESEYGVRRPLPVLLTGALTKGGPAPGLRAPRFPRAAKAAVRRFFTLATPAARRLATQLAAIPIDFDLVEQLRRRTMPETGPDHVAEILMGGLIDWDGAGEERPEFADGVREELLATTTRSQLAHAISVVGDLPAAGERGWARSELAVMHALSGPYTEGAKGTESDGGHAPTVLKPVGVGASPGGPAASDPSNEQPDESGVPVPLVTDALQQEALGAEPLMSSTATTATPALLVNVPLRNTSFVGRQELLRAVEEQLTGQDTAAVLPHALHGLGGVGKSQLALEYAFTHQHEYKVICWINAEREAQVLASLASLAAQLRVAPTGADSVGAPAANNAESIEKVRSYFPTNGPGKVIVTSRNRAWERVATPLRVDVFERQESIELLQKRSPDLTAEDANRLAMALGNLPLAVEEGDSAYAVPAWEEASMTTPK